MATLKFSETIFDEVRALARAYFIEFDSPEEMTYQMLTDLSDILWDDYRNVSNFYYKTQLYKNYSKVLSYRDLMYSQTTAI